MKEAAGRATKQSGEQSPKPKEPVFGGTERSFAAEKHPGLSVIMPVYNTKEECLREAISGISGQTYGDFELLAECRKIPDFAL